MNTLSYITKEAALYSSIILASTIFILKKLLSRRKVNKLYYSDAKKKAAKKMKLFFNDLSKKVIIVSEKNNLGPDSNFSTGSIADRKLELMKQYVQKLSKEFLSNSEAPVVKHVTNQINEDKEDKDSVESVKLKKKIPPSKKDQIFFYLLNNVSEMMIQQTKIN